MYRGESCSNSRWGQLERLLRRSRVMETMDLKYYLKGSAPSSHYRYDSHDKQVVYGQ
jgi:hypothetical protein